MEVELVDLDDAIRLGERGVEIAPLVHAFPHEVRAGFLVQHRRLSIQRLARIDERRQCLVLDLDELGCVARELPRLGDDGDDGLSDVAHLAEGEREVLDLPARRAGDLEERIGESRDLLAGERAVDALDLLGLRHVDRGDVCVRIRRPDEMDVAHPVALDVVDEDALALREPAVLLARDAFPEQALADFDLGRRDGRVHFATDLTASTMFQ